MSKFNIAEAKAHFSELVRKAMMGEEVIISKDNKPLVQLIPVTRPKGSRKAGSGKGQILYMASDFNATPEDFKDYV